MPWTLITGAAKGLGRAIALQLASQGHDLILHYFQSESEAKITAFECKKRGVKTELLQGDLSQPINLESFPQIFGIVNNASLYLTKPISQTSQSEWLKIIEINVTAPFFLINSLLLTLKENEGRVINIGTAGLHTHRANSYCPAYEISKSMLWNLTRILAKETATCKMTVNMVSPGIMTNSIDLSEKRNLLPSQNPCTPEEVARVVGFLFEKASSSITGQNIEVARGFSL